MSNKPVLIQAEAEGDIKDAYQWYESQRKGLGESYLLCIERSIVKNRHAHLRLMLSYIKSFDVH